MTPVHGITLPGSDTEYDCQRWRGLLSCVTGFHCQGIAHNGMSGRKREGA